MPRLSAAWLMRSSNLVSKMMRCASSAVTGAVSQALSATSAFQLAGIPAGVAEGNQIVLRPVASSDGFEHFPGGAQHDAAAEIQGCLEAFIGGVQDEAALHFHRPALHDDGVDGCRPFARCRAEQPAPPGLRVMAG